LCVLDVFKRKTNGCTVFIPNYVGRSLLEGALEDTTSHIDKSLVDTVISKTHSDKFMAVVKSDTDFEVWSHVVA